MHKSRITFMAAISLPTFAGCPVTFPKVLKRVLDKEGAFPYQPWPDARMMKCGLVFTAALFCCAHSVSAMGDYLTHLLGAVGQGGTNLAALAKSADNAASRFIAGGNLWVAGRQEDFIAEACGRAGGLTGIAPLRQQVPKKEDVILYAVPGLLEPGDRKLTRAWQEQGPAVITFSSSTDLYRERFPVDTVINVVDLWTWTGEFVAACTRRGRMPVLYQSYGLPGGVERGKKYQGKRFHDDLTIKPIPAEALGRKYRQQIEGMLKKIHDTQMLKILQGAKWWGTASSTTALFTGHMFPRHMQDPRSPALATLAAVPAWEDKDLLDADKPPQCVVYVGYQFAPRKLILQSEKMGVKLVYFDVEPNQPPEPAGNILYIDPGWPLADGCIEIRGYDIPILPASGVIDAAIYWTLAAERAP
jgi:hypothetical protein